MHSQTGRVKRQKLQTEVRQEQIIEAAMNLIASQGLKGLNMVALANRIGLVPSAIYRHFKSKDHIVDMILDFVQERLSTNIRTSCQETSEPMEGLRRILKRHVETLKKNRAIPRLIFSEDVFSGDPKKRRKYIKLSRGTLEGWRKLSGKVRRRDTSFRYGFQDGCSDVSWDDPTWSDSLVLKRGKVRYLKTCGNQLECF